MSTDKRHLKFGNSFAIRDSDTLAVLNESLHNTHDILDNTNIVDQFCNEYLAWINSGTKNTFIGLDTFEYKCYSNGTTESFDKFYMKNHARRFRCFKGEYMYHQLAWRNHWPNWKFIEDEKLAANDAVVISIPFADTGNQHKDYKTILKQCDKLGIPVLVDCAYYGICQGIEFDLSHKSITDVVFSLSKTFPVAHARIGMRLTRTDDDDPLFVVNKNGYVNRIGAHIGSKFLSLFSPDFLPERYRSKQETFCEHLGVEISSTILFGIGGESWQEYNRGSETNRLSFHKYIHQDIDIFIKDNPKNV